MTRKNKIPCYIQNTLAAGILSIAGAVSSGANAATCTGTVVNDWGSGFQAEISITNDTAVAISGWDVCWAAAGTTVTSLWNANQVGNCASSL